MDVKHVHERSILIHRIENEIVYYYPSDNYKAVKNFNAIVTPAGSHASPPPAWTPARAPAATRFPPPLYRGARPPHRADYSISAGLRRKNDLLAKNGQEAPLVQENFLTTGKTRPPSFFAFQIVLVIASRFPT